MAARGSARRACPRSFDAIARQPALRGRARERASLAPEIARHEPRGALFAGAGRARGDPRADRAGCARDRVATLALEDGAGQAGAVVASCCAPRASRALRVERDLAGIERVVDRGTRTAMSVALDARRARRAARVRRRGRRRGVPGRHRLRALLRPDERGGGRAAATSSRAARRRKPAAVMFFALAAALAALPELGEPSGPRCGAAARARDAAAAQPRAALPAAAGRRAVRTLGAARARLRALRAALGRSAAGAAVERQPLRRSPTRARLDDVSRGDPRRRRSRARRGRAARASPSTVVDLRELRAARALAGRARGRADGRRTARAGSLASLLAS